MTDEKNEYGRVFIDADGNRYNTKTEPIAEGGQGRIYLSSDKEIVIKTVLDDELSHEEYEDMLDRTSGIFIHPRAGIARPIVKLETPEKGYVMRFLDGGQAIGSLMKYKGNTLAEVLDEYNAGGGLKRRLLILKDLAKTLFYIHSAGAVYGDISDKNVFISKMPNAGIKSMISDDIKTWLIDADNIRVGNLDKALYTPGFGAPEVVKGQPNTAQSDMYSFGLLAYVLLNINNPFDGVSAEDDCWDAEPSQETDESAEEGGKAFIYDRSDKSNHAGAGMLPWQFGLTEKLLSLFERTFGIESRKKFTGRPSAAEWYIALSEAAGKTYYCDKCAAHHYFDATPHQGKYDGLIARIEFLTPTDDGYKVVDCSEIVVDGKTAIFDKKKLTSSLVEVPMLTIEVLEKEFKVTAQKGYAIDIFDGKGRLKNATTAILGDILLVTDGAASDEFTARITITRRDS